MHVRGRGRWLRAILVALALTLGASSLEIVLRSDDAPALSGVAFASVAQGKDDDKKKNDNDDKDDPDRVARGQVLEINTLKDPPEMILAGADGKMLVRVLKTDEIALNGVRLGDHLRLDGEKIHEQLFEAQQISVEDRCGC